jgi:hypothetical protein
VARPLHSEGRIMRNHSLLSTTFLLALGATAAGCAASAPGMGDDDGSGSGSGSGSVPLSPQGKFALQSDYDIATNMPGTAGDVINEIIKATDDPDDPSKYILEKIVDQLPDGSLKNVVKGAIPFAAGYLNDRLLDIAPDFVTKMLDMGDKLGQVAKHFGTLETLDVAANGMAVHVVNGVHFKVDQTELDFMFKDSGIKDVTVPGVLVTLDATGRLAIADHKVPLSYGAMVRLGVDEVIIPLVDPTAVDLSDVLHNLVDCHAVGQYLYDAIGIGSPSTFESGCTSGLTAGAHLVYTQIDKIDTAALEFEISGIAKGVDKNKDGKMDSIQTGNWTGTLAYSGSPAPLPPKAPFSGERM